MTRNWTPLAFAYLGVSVIGLVGTWWFNALAVIQMSNFVGDWIYVVLSGLTAFAFTFPLFLAMRQRRLAVILHSKG